MVIKVQLCRLKHDSTQGYPELGDNHGACLEPEIVKVENKITPDVALFYRIESLISPLLCLCLNLEIETYICYDPCAFRTNIYILVHQSVFWCVRNPYGF